MLGWFTGHSPDAEHPKAEPEGSVPLQPRSPALPAPAVATGGPGAVATPLRQRLQPRLAGETKRNLIPERNCGVSAESQPPGSGERAITAEKLGRHPKQIGYN